MKNIVIKKYYWDKIGVFFLFFILSTLWFLISEYFLYGLFDEIYPFLFPILTVINFYGYLSVVFILHTSLSPYWEKIKIKGEVVES